MPRSDPLDRSAIARALKAARDARNWTQEDVQFHLRLRGAEHDSIGSVKRWESLGSIQLADALMLASIYETTLEEMLAAASESSSDQDAAPDDELADRLVERDKEQGKPGRQTRRSGRPSNGSARR